MPGFAVTDEDRERTEATAKFIVEQFNRLGTHGMTLGDRDLALGLKTLKALEKKAKFPILVANLVDEASGKPIFETHAMIEADGHKFGVFGLTSGSAKPGQGWKISDAAKAAREQVEALKKEGAQVIILLSHLTDTAQSQLAKDVKGIDLILGSANPKMQKSIDELAPGTFASNGFSKGKYLAIVELNIHEGSKADGPFVDRFKFKSLQDKLEQTEARIKRYEQIVKSTSKRAGADAEPKEGPRGRVPRRRATNVQFYEQQIAKLKAEQQLAQMDLEKARAPDPKADFVTFEMYALAKSIEHDETTEKAVQAFRKKYPDKKKTHAHARAPVKRAVGPRRVQPSRRGGKAPPVKMKRAPVKRAPRLPGK